MTNQQLIKMKIRSILTAFSILLLLIGIGCQSKKTPAPEAKQGQELIDSLQNALAKSGQDSNRVNALNGLSEHAGWRLNQNDTCIAYAQKALALAQTINYKYGMGNAYHNLGNELANNSEYDKALESHFNALNIFKELNNKDEESKSYCNIANIHYLLSDYDIAIKYFKIALELAKETHNMPITASAYNGIGSGNVKQGSLAEGLINFNKALALLKKLGNKNDIAKTYGFIGYTYMNQGNFPESLKNHLASLRMFDALGDKKGMATCYLNIGAIYLSQSNYQEALKNQLSALDILKDMGDNYYIAGCYLNIGNTLMGQNNFPEALKSLTTALEMFDTVVHKYEIAQCYSNIADIYYIQGNYPEALKAFATTMKWSEAIGNKASIAYCYNKIGQICTAQNKISEAKDWLQKSLTLSIAIGTKTSIRDSYLGLAQINATMNNFKDAFEDYKLFTTYKDSIYNEDNTQKITQASMQYEFDKKQLADSLKNAEVRKLAAEKLSKQKNYTIMGAGLAVLLLGFSGFVFRNNKKLAAEKQKSESLLHNILPEEISAELKERGATTAKEFDAVTVLFTDFVNFTQAAEQLSPQALVQELHECFTAFDNIIERNGLEKIKTVGDAYLAVCGLPAADPRHAQKSVQAAIEIREFIEERKKHEKVFEIRIGIHTGSVVAGIVGVKKFAYDIWGDTVNTAARMEQSCEAGKINISETTHELVKNDFECLNRGAVEVKGKGKMNMYFVN